MIQSTARLLGAAFAVGTALCLALPARAQTQDPPPDHAAIITLQDENASITTSNLPDRYYVNGLRLGYTSGEGDLPDFASRIGRALWGDGRQRVSFDLSQEIYTPAQTGVLVPPRSDEPYAGVLTGDFSLYQDYEDWRSILGAQIGIAGPAAGAQQLQNGFHNLIGQGKTLGWCCYHIKNEPVLELLSERIWREPLGTVGGLETDMLPNLTVGVGNLRIYALSGALFRFGQGLASDFGPSRIRPGMTGGDAYTPVLPFNWYVFGGFDGQAVAHDLVLDGNTWLTSPSVSRKPLVGELEVGAAIIVQGVRISYTQVFQTDTFRGEHGGLHQFGSLAGAIRF